LVFPGVLEEKSEILQHRQLAMGDPGGPGLRNVIEGNFLGDDLGVFIILIERLLGDREEQLHPADDLGGATPFCIADFPHFLGLQDRR
jgi:hypothetical protein